VKNLGQKTISSTWIVTEKHNSDNVKHFFKVKPLTEMFISNLLEISRKMEPYGN